MELEDKNTAYLVETDGIVKEIAPSNGTDFNLEELQGYVGGYIEALRTVDDRLLIINEEGKLLKLQPNLIATGMYIHGVHDVIVGEAIICPDRMMK